MVANTGAGTGSSKIRNAKPVLLGGVGKSSLVLRFKALALITLLNSHLLSPLRAVAVEGKPMVLVAEKLGFALVVRSGTNVGRDVFEASDGRLHIVGRVGAGIGNGYLFIVSHNSQPEVVTFDLIPDRDLVVEPMSTTGSIQPSRPDIRSSPSASSENVRARNSGSSSRSAASPPAAPQAGAANPLRFDARTIHFSVNAWVLVVAGVGMLPILPKHLADRACKLSLLGIVLSSGYSLYSTYGKPRELNMPAIQSWLQSVLGAKDFIHLMFSLLLVTSQLHLKIAALPVFCWALYHVARFLRRNFSRSSFYRGYLEEPCLWVDTNNTTLSLLSSNAELPLGFLLIISLFSWRRNFMQTFMYSNSAWAKIGRTVNPYIDRFRGIL
ncbi:hypothetical protein ZWY2020_020859 [Hordeum vulgare]|nr:hypothetical protein ZWY2020_020859 [Hordeum vulgare]